MPPACQSALGVIELGDIAVVAKRLEHAHWARRGKHAPIIPHPGPKLCAACAQAKEFPSSPWCNPDILIL